MAGAAAAAAAWPEGWPERWPEVRLEEPDERDGFSIEDYHALGEDRDGKRHEFIDGEFLVSPSPAGRHQVVARRLATLLAAAASPGLEVVEALGVRIGDDVLIPDIVVATEKALLTDDHEIDADHVQAVIEIVSPGSSRIDRRIKPALYAEAGIPTFIRIVLPKERSRRPGGVEAFVNTPEREYKESGRAKLGQPLGLSRPFEVTIDLARLLALRTEPSSPDA